MHKTLILCIFTLFASSNLVAQTPSGTPSNPPDYKGPVNLATSGDRPVPKQISGGVLNSKAISLPKPNFPAAARAVGASGAVTVQVLIDENGDVISANAVSGHPLLRAASTEAAQGAKFTPTSLQGIPVKVSGVITYYFIGPLYPARLGFTLSHAAHAEKTASFDRYSSPESLAHQLPADWIQEKEILNSLTFEVIPVVPPKAEEKKKTKQMLPDSSSPGVPRVTNRYTVKGDANYTGTVLPGYIQKLDAKSLSSLQNLLSLIETRTSENESSAWGYELGTALGVLVAEIEDQAKFASNFAKVETLAERAPSTVSQYSLQRVKEFIEFCKTDNLRDENRREIITKAEMLSNLRY